MVGGTYLSSAIFSIIFHGWVLACSCQRTTRSLVVMWSLWHTNVLIMTQRLVLFMREYEIIYFNIIMCMAPLKTGSFTEHGGVQHFIQLHHQVQLEYGLRASYVVYVNIGKDTFISCKYVNMYTEFKYVNMYSELFRGFSDSLLASRQLYTEDPSHKLSAMLTEVGRQFSFKKYFDLLLR